VPVGPRYDIAVAINAPMYRLNSDGKAPDVSPFRHQIEVDPKNRTGG
jgi:hypothetical protein